jgi:hypothetical protein
MYFLTASRCDSPDTTLDSHIQISRHDTTHDLGEPWVEEQDDVCGGGVRPACVGPGPEAISISPRQTVMTWDAANGFAPAFW